jgi:hypothetical protein
MGALEEALLKIEEGVTSKIAPKPALNPLKMKHISVI